MENRRLRLKHAWLIILFALAPVFMQAQEKLTIDRALDIAEENNPTLKTQRLNFERAKFLLEAQRLSLRSRFSLDLTPVDYSRTRMFENRISEWYTNEKFSTSGTFRVVQPILLTDGQIALTNEFGWMDNNSLNTQGASVSNQAFSNNLMLRLDQPIFTYNKRKMELKKIEFDYENSRINYALQRLRTEQSITRQFYTVYMAKNQLEVSREELKNAKENFDLMKDKVDADMSAREELYQAELNYVTAQSKLEQNIVALENAKDEFKQILGMSLNENLDVEAEIIVNPVAVDLEQAIIYGLNSRMELRQREISMEEAELDMITVKAQNEFSGNIGLSLGITGDNKNFDNIYDSPVTSPRVMLTFSVPIFDWGVNKKRINAQKAAQTIAKLNHDNEKINIELNVRQTWRELESLRLQIDIAEKRVNSAQLTYDINQIRYRNGDLTGMQMSQFQTQLSTNKISYWQQQINYKIQLLNLKILSLYDFEKDEPLVPLSKIYDEQ